MRNNLKEKKLKIERRHRRIRAKIKGTSKRPRLLVFRSNRHIYGQLIDDEKSIRVSLELGLKKLDATIYSAVNGYEGLDLFKRNKIELSCGNFGA